jgi:hypothetical protein
VFELGNWPPISPPEVTHDYLLRSCMSFPQHTAHVFTFQCVLSVFDG